MGLFDWLGYGISHGYFPHPIGGIGDTPHFATDINTPYGTPITALWSGTIVSQRTGLPWGTEVFIKPDDSSIPEYYYYHLDTLNTYTGEHVSAGDTIGLSGGQNSGGSNPSTPAMSSGPHTHVGFFSQFVTVTNNYGNLETIPSGPDITPFIQALAKGANTSHIQVGQNSGDTSANLSSFLVGTGQKLGLIAVALTLLVVGAMLLMPEQTKAVGGAIKKGIQTSIAPETLAIPKKKEAPKKEAPKKDISKKEVATKEVKEAGARETKAKAKVEEGTEV